MGPLVPEIIGSEFNLIVAFIIGIGFGFILEQAGFSSSRKLAGLFYGYDFTVLKVFFTAGVTAMIGVLLLAHMNLLDLNIIYVNPTFLYSAIIGGIIMGAGFVIGGFCPGTSICAAAIGKIDAMVFIFGSVLGIFLFTEGYPFLEGLYKMENWGAVRIDRYLSVSPELFAVLLTAIAIGAFIVATRIENKVNGITVSSSNKIKIKYYSLGVVPFVLIAFMAFTPNRMEYIQQQIISARQQKKCVIKEISSDKLGYELTHNHYKINLIDVRKKESFEQYHLPLAINIPLDEIMNREWRSYFVQKHMINVFYADEDTTAKKACLSVRFIGDSENYVLNESTAGFRDKFFNTTQPSENASKEEYNIYSFRVHTAAILLNLEDALKKFSTPVKKKIKKVKGGCY